MVGGIKSEKKQEIKTLEIRPIALVLHALLIEVLQALLILLMHILLLLLLHALLILVLQRLLLRLLYIVLILLLHAHFTLGVANTPSVLVVLFVLLNLVLNTLLILHSIANTLGLGVASTPNLSVAHAHK